MTCFKNFSALPIAFFLHALVLPLHAQLSNTDGFLINRLIYHVHTLADDSMEGRSQGSGGKEVAMAYIANHFEASGLQPFQNGSYLQPFQLHRDLVNLNLTNVIGLVEGSNPLLRDEYIVLGAHYDHIGFKPQKEDEDVVFNGANDNASGVAMLLELARYFSKNPEKTARTIIFIAFDANKIGLKGAGYFVENSGLDDISAICMMFSLDMVGMYKAKNGLDIKGIRAILGGSALADSLAEKHGIRLKNTSAEIERRSNTWPFGEAGIPSVCVTTGLISTFYYQLDDTADLLEYESMARITSYMKELVSELSSQPSLGPSPQFRGIKTLKFGIMLSIAGSRHIYTDEFYNGKAMFSPGLGMFAQFRINNIFTVQPELLYNYNRSLTADGKFRRHSITLPINLQAGFLDDVSHRLYYLGGAYGQYSFAGKAGDQTLDLGGLHREIEWGINFGFGYQIDKVNIAYIWRRAINTLTTDGLKSYATSILFTVGYNI